jgi:hypothetical protein
MTTRFTFHSDPGHAWLEVTSADLSEVGLAPASFSRFSYQDGETFYLEEDCDATVFLDAHAKLHGKGAVSFNEQFKDPTPIRDMASLADSRWHRRISRAHP